MSAKSNTFENDWMLLLFNNTNIANIGDATGLRGSSTAGVLYISLHTADPGEAGDQTTNEANYTGYARKSVNRASGAGGFTVSGNNAENTSAVTFDPCTAGSNTITHFGIGTALSGAGKLLYKGTVTPNLAVSNGITPEIPAGGCDVSEE